MGNAMKKFRLAVQIAFTALSNGYLKGFMGKGLYQGPLKQVCLPGLNCYSCPGALGACPIGSLQAVISSRQFDFSFYIVGFFMAAGALGGRLTCGFLCPFGLLQDLLYRVPLKKPMPLKLSRYWDLLRYGVLVLVVMILPVFAVNIIGQGDPWFCKVLCPSGTVMAALPQLLVNPELFSAVGGLFWFKLTTLITLLLLSLKIYRPFCRYLCPLGAIYGLFNPIALYHFKFIESACTHCGACAAACPMGLDPAKTPNSPKCVRCGDCTGACKQKALLPAFGIVKNQKKRYNEASHSGGPL